MEQDPVFLDQESAELLREHREAQLAMRLRADEAWRDDNLAHLAAAEQTATLLRKARDARKAS
jgi:hypothetical protein